ncbi:glutamate--tRNA ligase [candidate division WWE3 bacterium]|nr:glutamate--tRNA ligase [candidate division WWE3 bacterium]
MSVRVRMAPSPTGEYHIGHIRTVLYNWAFAKKEEGTFVIRIEDTDRERFVEGAADRILAVISLYGLDWDEGPNKGGSFGPYTQSKRLDLYKDYAENLVEQGDAYYCFCTKERLSDLRKQQREQGIPPKYDKKCLGLSKDAVKERLEAGESHVIRLNVPENRDITFSDVVYGDITVNTNDIDDQVLLKSDGFPTYHLAVVIDDHLMEITHIMRGMDWIPSTPKHVLLYEAFGWDLPIYAHLPNIKELGGSKKLSKRFGSVYAIEFLKEGYLSEALLNFLMFLGWNPGTEKEIYTLEEFIEDFSLEDVHKTDLVAFDRKKLLWMNGQYIRNLETKDLWQKLKEWSERFEIDLGVGEISEEYILQALSLVQTRMKLLPDFMERTTYFFKEPEIPVELLTKYAKSPERTKEILEKFIDLYEGVKEWSVEILDQTSHELIEKHDYSPKEAFMTVRVAISGRKATPPLFDMLGLIGKEKSVNRLKESLKLLE